MRIVWRGSSDQFADHVGATCNNAPCKNRAMLVLMFKDWVAVYLCERCANLTAKRLSRLTHGTPKHLTASGGQP